MHQIVFGASNSSFFNLLFGDLVFIERYLRFVGWRLDDGDVPGSNFGCEQRQDNPFLCAVGEGTVASDGLMLGNYQMSSHAFRLNPCRVGKHNFLGTDVYVPPGVRVGDNVMFATKVMAPIDGPMRENVGLLGSPAFEIPRAAARDVELLAEISLEERARRLEIKTRHNVATMAVFIFSHWFVEFFALYAVALAAAEFGATSFFGLAAAAAAAGSWASVPSSSLRAPRSASSGSNPKWRRSTIRRSGASNAIGSSPTGAPTLFAGSPLRNVVSRWLGVRVGRMVFDDGCMVSEHSLVEIGDEANLNQTAFIQSHSLEEGVFKSDRVFIGAYCALAPGSFVHYGVTMHEHTLIDADSFLMKGEITPPHSRWRGNPAKLLHVRAPSANG